MFILKRFKIFKNEACPCGSGQTYGKCCYDKNDANFDTDHTQKLLLDISKMFDSYKYETCLHPNSDECKPPIKSAHSIQNHGVLSQISYKNHVMGFRTDKTNPFKIMSQDPSTIALRRELDKIGVNDATTHTCFCNYHDSKVFAPIESSPKGFDPTDNEQLFLFAYKAFAFEFYKSRVAFIAMQNLFKNLPAKLKKHPFLFVPEYRGAQLKELEMSYYKQRFDNMLINNEYSDIYTEVIEIPFKIEFATIDCISPRFDITGGKVKQFTKGFMKRMFMTIFPFGDKSYILLSYLKEDSANFNKYVTAIKGTELQRIYEYFSTFLPLYSESIVLNPKLLEKWGKEATLAFTSLSNLIGKDLIQLENQFALNLFKSYHRNSNLEPTKCNLFIEL